MVQPLGPFHNMRCYDAASRQGRRRCCFGPGLRGLHTDQLLTDEHCYDSVLGGAKNAPVTEHFLCDREMFHLKTLIGQKAFIPCPRACHWPPRAQCAKHPCPCDGASQIRTRAWAVAGTPRLSFPHERVGGLIEKTLRNQRKKRGLPNRVETAPTRGARGRVERPRCGRRTERTGDESADIKDEDGQGRSPRES